MTLDELIQQLCSLHTGLVGSGDDRHEKPHKPVMVLAAMERMDLGAPTDRVEWDQALRGTFKRLFEVVRTEHDKPTPDNPFLYLRSDGFWRPVLRGDGGEVPLDHTPLVAEIGQAVAYLAPPVAGLLSDPSVRLRAREALIARYFSHAREALHAAALPGSPSTAEAALLDEAAARGRSGAFRRVVLEHYDHQCAACGLRLPDKHFQTSIVDAAHIVPFSETRDDHPKNGMALCKNHHWAMDRHLIAPTPERLWRASPALVPRRSSAERELQDLDGRPLLVPAERAYLPRPEALAWRADRLLRRA